MDIIRSALAQEIFRQDLISVYERQTTHRDELRRASREKVAGLVQQISGGACENPKLESLLRELAEKLSNVKGKKVYGYLRHDLKTLVNQIVDELAKDERITQLYDLWYQDKQAARNIYDERPIERLPLSENATQWYGRRWSWTWSSDRRKTRTTPRPSCPWPPGCSVK